MQQKPYKSETSAMAVVFCGNCILATEEDIYGHVVLSLPKGHVEGNETHEQTAIRECLEETGIVLTPQQVTKSVEPFSYKFMDKHVGMIHKQIFPVVFVLQSVQQPHITESGIKSVQFLPVEEFLKKCSYTNVRNLVKQIIFEDHA